MGRLSLVGQVFGRLTVKEKVGTHKRRGIIWKCDCSCGGTAKVATSRLKESNTKSCGCLRRKTAVERPTIGTEYTTWTQWTPEQKALFKTNCDEEVARLTGRSINAVRTYRYNNNIPKYGSRIRENLGITKPYENLYEYDTGRESPLPSDRIGPIDLDGL